MSKLRPCSACSSFVPNGASSCPVCDAAAPLASSARSGDARTNSGPSNGGLSSKALKGFLAIGAGSLLAMTLSACYGVPIGPTPYCDDPSRDLDGDGYCGDYDCDESDFSINTGATDDSVDGVDQNCDMVDGPVGDAGM